MATVFDIYMMLQRTLVDNGKTSFLFNYNIQYIQISLAQLK